MVVDVLCMIASVSHVTNTLCKNRYVLIYNFTIIYAPTYVAYIHVSGDTSWKYSIDLSACLSSYPQHLPIYLSIYCSWLTMISHQATVIKQNSPSIVFSHSSTINHHQIYPFNLSSPTSASVLLQVTWLSRSGANPPGNCCTAETARSLVAVAGASRPPRIQLLTLHGNSPARCLVHSSCHVIKLHEVNNHNQPKYYHKTPSIKQT